MNPVLHGLGVALMVAKHRALVAFGIRNRKSGLAADKSAQA